MASLELGTRPTSSRGGLRRLADRDSERGCLGPNARDAVAGRYPSSVRPTDLRVLEAVLKRAGKFGHREHLELAWSYLDRYPLAAAKQAMTSAIRHLAAEHGAADKYHETLTLAWMHLVAVHRERWPARTFEEFIGRNPELLDSHLLDEHYGSDVLWRDDARAAWTEPDLRALPALASS
jgi:hypothetical protein